jgi:hypothetical protein
MPSDPIASAAVPRSTPARLATIALGYLLLVTGTVLLVLPGPGVPLILAGLAVVGRQHDWARRVEGPLRERAARLVRRVASWSARPRGEGR